MLACANHWLSDPLNGFRRRESPFRKHENVAFYSLGVSYISRFKKVLGVGKEMQNLPLFETPNNTEAELTLCRAESPDIGYPYPLYKGEHDPRYVLYVARLRLLATH